MAPRKGNASGGALKEADKDVTKLPNGKVGPTSRYGSFYHAMKSKLKNHETSGWPGIMKYVGLLIELPNHRENDIYNGIIKRGIEQWEAA